MECVRCMRGRWTKGVFTRITQPAAHAHRQAGAKAGEQAGATRARGACARAQASYSTQAASPEEDIEDKDGVEAVGERDVGAAGGGPARGW